ncbi:MAG: hypothetical protein ACLPQY_27145 [Streptosporangiaceae bacterium]
MKDDKLQRLQQEVADEVSRRLAEDQVRPPWRVALDELCMANAENPEFWAQMQLVAVPMFGWDDDEDPAMGQRMAAAFYAKRCRICGRPIHKIWFRCDWCHADNYGPDVIKGATVAVEIEN